MVSDLPLKFIYNLTCINMSDNIGLTIPGYCLFLRWQQSGFSIHHLFLVEGAVGVII